MAKKSRGLRTCMATGGIVGEDLLKTSDREASILGSGASTPMANAGAGGVLSRAKAMLEQQNQNAGDAELQQKMLSEGQAQFDAINGMRGLSNRQRMAALGDVGGTLSKFGVRTDLNDLMGSSTLSNRQKLAMSQEQFGINTNANVYDAKHQPKPGLRMGGSMGLASTGEDNGRSWTRPASVSQGIYGMKAGGVVKDGTTPTADDVPVNLSKGEAVLPHKTVQALGGPEAVEEMIEQTNGKPVHHGLRRGGNYAEGELPNRYDVPENFKPTPTVGNTGEKFSWKNAPDYSALEEPTVAREPLRVNRTVGPENLRAGAEQRILDGVRMNDPLNPQPRVDATAANVPPNHASPNAGSRQAPAPRGSGIGRTIGGLAGAAQALNAISRFGNTKEVYDNPRSNWMDVSEQGVRDTAAAAGDLLEGVVLNKARRIPFVGRGLQMAGAAAGLAGYGGGDAVNYGIDKINGALGSMGAKAPVERFRDAAAAEQPKPETDAEKQARIEAAVANAPGASGYDAKEAARAKAVIDARQQAAATEGPKAPQYGGSATQAYIDQNGLRDIKQEGSGKGAAYIGTDKNGKRVIFGGLDYTDDERKKLQAEEAERSRADLARQKDYFEREGIKSDLNSNDPGDVMRGLRNLDMRQNEKYYDSLAATNKANAEYRSEHLKIERQKADNEANKQRLEMLTKQEQRVRDNAKAGQERTKANQDALTALFGGKDGEGKKAEFLGSSAKYIKEEVDKAKQILGNKNATEAEVAKAQSTIAALTDRDGAPRSVDEIDDASARQHLVNRFNDSGAARDKLSQENWWAPTAGSAIAATGLGAGIYGAAKDAAKAVAGGKITSVRDMKRAGARGLAKIAAGALGGAAAGYGVNESLRNVPARGSDNAMDFEPIGKTSKGDFVLRNGQIIPYNQLALEDSNSLRRRWFHNSDSDLSRWAKLHPNLPVIDK